MIQTILSAADNSNLIKAILQLYHNGTLAEVVCWRREQIEQWVVKQNDHSSV